MLRTLKHSFFALLVHLRRGDMGVLTVRWLALLIAIAWLSVAAAELPEQKKKESTKSTEVTDAAKSNAPQPPIVIEIKPPSSIQVETTTNKHEAKEKV
jgi:hypothetical protein